MAKALVLASEMLLVLLWELLLASEMPLVLMLEMPLVSLWVLEMPKVLVLVMVLRRYRYSSHCRRRPGPVSGRRCPKDRVARATGIAEVVWGFVEQFRSTGFHTRHNRAD